MTQSEKLDTILRYLYDRKDDGKQYSITTILEESPSGARVQSRILARRFFNACRCVIGSEASMPQKSKVKNDLDFG